MYMVYWTEQSQPQASLFGSDALKAALDFMESLRRRQRQGEAVAFVTMCSEHPDSVGHPGVAETGPDYQWKKRRR